VCNEIEHDHTLHESLHHNEHRRRPSCVANRHFDPEILTGRNLGIYALQEIYQAAIHAVTAHMGRLRSSLRGSLPVCAVRNCAVDQLTRSTSRTSAGASHAQNIGRTPGLHVEQSEPTKVAVAADRKPRGF
jgi:hypothetical protein